MARFGLNENVFIGCGYRHQSLGVESDLEGYVCIYDDYGEYVCANMEWDVNLHEFLFFLGLMTAPAKYTTPIVYGSFGLGATKHNIELTLSADGASESAKTDETKFAIFGDLGVLFPFNATFGLDLSASIRVTGDFSSDGGYSGYGNYGNTGLLFGFRGGVVFFIGGNEISRRSWALVI